MIIIIDNYDSFTFNLYQMVAALVSDVIVIRNDKISIAEIKDLKPTGIILSPGPGRPEAAGICIDVIKAFYATVPILGVCLGHQAIAIAFASSVIQADEIVHGKPAYIFHNRLHIFKDMPLPFVAGRYHSLIVDRTNLAPELTVVAENQQGLIMALKHQQYPVFGVQFHPESILTPQGKQLIENFILTECGEKPLSEVKPC